MQPDHPADLTPATPGDADLPAVDLMRRFVRIQERREDGLVAFEFSIGWPELAVELLLPTMTMPPSQLARIIAALSAPVPP